MDHVEKKPPSAARRAVFFVDYSIAGSKFYTHRFSYGMNVFISPA